MSENNQLTNMHREHIYRYYQSLQTFFNITGSKHDRSNSVRAQKARAKLIKLSLMQFFELSTDVNDELNRRVSESVMKPDHLPPKQNFHLKRNQARQKLANLSQTRFTDLVDDILYEIKRRDLATAPNFNTESTTDVEKIDGQEEDAYNDSSKFIFDNMAANTSLQEFKVIPKKASIDWSSADEDINFDHDYKSDKKSFTTASINGSLGRSKDNLNKDSISELNNEKNVPLSLDEKSNEKSNEINENLLNEIAMLRTKLNAAEQENLLRSSGTTHYDESLRKEVLHLSKQIKTLSVENEQLKQTISEMKLSKNHKIISIESTQDLLLEYKNKYKLKPSEFEKYISENGLLSFDSIKIIHGYLISFFEVLLNPETNSIGNQLFFILFKVADVTNQIIEQITTSIFKNEIVLLKASLSHLITSIRYYSVYGTAIPKVTIFSAVTELAFALLNLISQTKIKTTNDGDINYKKTDNLSNIKQSHYTNNSINEFNDASTFEFSDDVSSDNKLDREEKSPVKPFKLLQKASKNSMKPTTGRKISGAGFATSLLDTHKSNRSTNLSSDNFEERQKYKNTADIRNVKKVLNINQSKNENAELPSINAGQPDSNHANTMNSKPEITNPSEFTPTKDVDDLNDTDDLNFIVSPLAVKTKSHRKDDAIASLPPKLPTTVIDDNDTTSIDHEVESNQEVPQITQKAFTNKVNKFNSFNGIGLRVENGDLNKDYGHSIDKLTFQKQSFDNKTANFVAKGNSQMDGTISSNHNTFNSAKFLPAPSTITSKMMQAFEEAEELAKTPKKSLSVSSVVGLPPQPMPDSIAIEKDDLNANPELKSSKTEVNTNFKATKEAAVKIQSESEGESSDEESDSESEEEVEFDFDAFDIENPDNTLSELLLYLEHQTVEVISTIQSLLTSIKQPKSTKGKLRLESNAISNVIGQMVEATNVSMNQSRNINLKEHGSWVVQSLIDCERRMATLCEFEQDGSFVPVTSDTDYAEKHFKQRLAGIAFDVAKCTKELVKSVEEASLKEEIEYLNTHMK